MLILWTCSIGIICDEYLLDFLTKAHDIVSKIQNVLSSDFFNFCWNEFLEYHRREPPLNEWRTESFSVVSAHHWNRSSFHYFHLPWTWSFDDRMSLLLKCRFSLLFDDVYNVRKEIIESNYFYWHGKYSVHDLSFIERYLIVKFD